MTRKEIRAEILTMVRKYDDLGIVDYVTIDNLLKTELRKFGSNVMERKYKVLEIVGGEAELPFNFFRMVLAIKCQPYKVDPVYEVDTKWRTDYGMTKRIVENYEWDNMSNSHYKKSYKEIIEKKEVRGSIIHITHNPIEVLTLTRGIPNEFIENSSINKLVSKTSGASEINIKQTKVQTNFKEGFVYLEYDALPEEDGDLLIPDIPYLDEYLKYFCVYRVLESIWTNGESTDVVDKIKYYKNEANLLKASALTASKFEGLSPDWSKKVAIKNRNNIRKYYR